jgi:nitrogen fixation protein NifB
MKNECSKATIAVNSKELAKITAHHPCYSFDAHHQFARMHLPVAPICNISCNYCNRKYDCVNESRPGVTSEILTPEMSLAKFIRVKAEILNLSVVGIAGPGDALANWDDVKRSIELIKAQSPDTIFCLSTNGLMISHYGQEIIELGIKHVTVTVNCVNPLIGAQIYHHVNYKGNYYTGESAAEILIANQMAGIQLLADQGVLVKVNIVMIKDINADHIVEVVKKVKQLGAFMTNIMPLIPAPGSAFETSPQTSMKDIRNLREICRLDIPQMTHCQQCRADAIGLLTADQSYKFRMSKPETVKIQGTERKSYKVAVASKYRKLVDLHFGHAEEFHIYMIDGSKISFVETRKIKKYGDNSKDCDEQEEIKDAVIKTIADCDAVLTMRIGYNARKRLVDSGICCIESCNSVEEGLKQVLCQLEMKRAM